jgi:hypothetical protein
MTLEAPSTAELRFHAPGISLCRRWMISCHSAAIQGKCLARDLVTDTRWPAQKGQPRRALACT